MIRLAAKCFVYIHIARQTFLYVNKSLILIEKWFEINSISKFIHVQGSKQFYQYETNIGPYRTLSSFCGKESQLTYYKFRGNDK